MASMSHVFPHFHIVICADNSYWLADQAISVTVTAVAVYSWKLVADRTRCSVTVKMVYNKSVFEKLMSQPGGSLEDSKPIMEVLDAVKSTEKHKDNLSKMKPMKLMPTMMILGYL